MMAKLSFDVEVSVEGRKNYFAAKTQPFAITVYGKTEEEAEERALEAVSLLLDKYARTITSLSGYLNRMGVKHVVYDKDSLAHRRTIIRECRREMRLEVPAGA